MNNLCKSGLDFVFHIAPIHYLTFIARSEALKSKSTLRSEGFGEDHFRSKSAHLDVRRGFGDYIHLSTNRHPPILQAKLAAGFPHICISIPSIALGDVGFDLCRFNVAMTRKLRREDKAGFSESLENGRYYDGMQIPIARTEQEQIQLIAAQKGNMLEVLRRPPLQLPAETTLVVFNSHDRETGQRILAQFGIDWIITLSNEPNYEPRADYTSACHEFVQRSLADPDWRGNGLEFDKV